MFLRRNKLKEIDELLKKNKYDKKNIKTNMKNYLDLKPKLTPRNNSNFDVMETCFLGFVLLRDDSFDFSEFKHDLSSMWHIQIVQKSNEDGVLVFRVGGMTATVTMVEVPVQTSEVEIAACKNYRWKESLETVRQHKAHLMVSVAGQGTPKQRGVLFTKLVYTCCLHENALGIYFNDTVYNPENYKELASIIDVDDDSILPILNLVWLGFRKSENGLNMYTKGMNAFGKDEMEIIDSPLLPNTLHNIMLDLVNYVLENNIVLRDGETIDFTQYQNLKIARSPGVSISEMSLKIEIGMN